jgi:hypothetical protein
VQNGHKHSDNLSSGVEIPLQVGDVLLFSANMIGCASNVAGFSLHAGAMSNAQDRRKLERLCRYITRSGVSEKRLAITTYGKVRYQLKTPYSSCRDIYPNLLKLRLLTLESL